MFDMLSTIMKNLVSRPATRKYPYVKRKEFKNARGKVDIDIEGCIFCGMCSRKCPADAIKVDRPNTTWEIDPFKCVVCNSCVEVCPKKCLRMDEKRTETSLKKQKLTFKKVVSAEKADNSSAK